MRIAPPPPVHPGGSSRSRSPVVDSQAGRRRSVRSLSPVTRSFVPIASPQQANSPAVPRRHKSDARMVALVNRFENVDGAIYGKAGSNKETKTHRNFLGKNWSVDEKPHSAAKKNEKLAPWMEKNLQDVQEEKATIHIQKDSPGNNDESTKNDRTHVSVDSGKGKSVDNKEKAAPWMTKSKGDRTTEKPAISETKPKVSSASPKEKVAPWVKTNDQEEVKFANKGKNSLKSKQGTSRQRETNDQSADDRVYPHPSVKASHWTQKSPNEIGQNAKEDAVSPYNAKKEKDVTWMKDRKDRDIATKASVTRSKDKVAPWMKKKSPELPRKEELNQGKLSNSQQPGDDADAKTRKLSPAGNRDKVSPITNIYLKQAGNEETAKANISTSIRKVKPPPWAKTAIDDAGSGSGGKLPAGNKKMPSNGGQRDNLAGARNHFGHKVGVASLQKEQTKVDSKTRGPRTQRPAISEKESAPAWGGKGVNKIPPWVKSQAKQSDMQRQTQSEAVLPDKKVSSSTTNPRKAHSDAAPVDTDGPRVDELKSSAMKDSTVESHPPRNKVIVSSKPQMLPQQTTQFEAEWPPSDEKPQETQESSEKIEELSKEKLSQTSSTTDLTPIDQMEASQATVEQNSTNKHVGPTLETPTRDTSMSDLIEFVYEDSFVVADEDDEDDEGGCCSSSDEGAIPDASPENRGSAATTCSFELCLGPADDVSSIGDMADDEEIEEYIIDDISVEGEEKLDLHMSKSIADMELRKMFSRANLNFEMGDVSDLEDEATDETEFEIEEDDDDGVLMTKRSSSAGSGLASPNNGMASPRLSAKMNLTDAKAYLSTLASPTLSSPSSMHRRSSMRASRRMSELSTQSEYSEYILEESEGDFSYLDEEIIEEEVQYSAEEEVDDEEEVVECTEREYDDEVYRMKLTAT